MNGDELKVFQPEYKPDMAALMQQAQFANGAQRTPNMLDANSINASTAQLYGTAPFGVAGGPVRLNAAAPGSYGGMQIGAAALQLGMGAGNINSSAASHPLVTPPKAESGAYRELTSLGAGSFTPTPSEQFGGGAATSGGLGSTPPGSACAVPTGASKYQCAICGDRASGKHYGVFSCEGCKGFFKRTVRKDLTYTCRDDRNCPIDKRQRNRCQFCRYNRCLAAGMKREAVQEERLRAKEKTVASGCTDAIDFQRVLQAELATEPCEAQEYTPQRAAFFNASASTNGRPIELHAVSTGASNGEPHASGAQPSLVVAADRQLYMLVEWAKRLPHFGELPLDDQIALLRAGWNELLIAAFAFRSTQLPDADALLIANGVQVRRDAAHALGVGAIFDRVLVELVAKMREMKLDRVEVGCLRAIILFNADVKSLQCVSEVEAAREKYYLTLEEYCKTTYPAEPTRFAKILLRMPALRSIGLKCLEHLFFFKLLGDSPADSFLAEMLNETLLKNADDYHPSPPLPPASAATASVSVSAPASQVLCAGVPTSAAAGQPQLQLAVPSAQAQVQVQVQPQVVSSGSQPRIGFAGNSLGALNAGF